MTDFETVYVIRIDGDTTDADYTGVSKTITATGAEWRVAGPLAKALKNFEDALKNELDKYKNGYKGACYACEPVGELNLKQRDTIDALASALRKAMDDTPGWYDAARAALARLEQTDG